MARLISAPHRPTPVPMGVVGALLASIDELGLVRFYGGLKPGHPVRVVAGPFAQVLGVLQRPPPRGASSSAECHGPPGIGHKGPSPSDWGLIVPFASPAGMVAGEVPKHGFGSVSPEVR